MKKTLVSALTTALVVGAASTTFAAANPFSDVPADHWAYDAVAQLAQDGVVNGYGDGTYRGQQNITRYEMAQIIAKAMAKTDVSAADKAMIDKLAAEFSDELNNLGVRVSNLEKKVDNVKFDGFVRYEYVRRNKEGGDNNTKQHIVLRLNPTMQINDKWTAHARIEHSLSTDAGTNTTYGSSKGGYREDYTHVNKAWAEADYGTTNIKLGRFGTFSNGSHGMALDDNITGAQVTFGKDVKFQLAGGRYNWDSDQANYTMRNGAGSNYYNTPTATYWAVDVSYAKDKFDAGIGYREYKGQQFANYVNSCSNNYIAAAPVQHADSATTFVDGVDKDKIAAWDLGFGYHFTPTVYFNADYAAAVGAADYLSSDDKKSYNIQLTYKGMNPANKGSFGIWTAYRHLAYTTTVVPTYDSAIYVGEKGWDFGINYAFAKNITGDVEYFTGKQFDDNNSSISRIYTNLTFLF